MHRLLVAAASMVAGVALLATAAAAQPSSSLQLVVLSSGTSQVAGAKVAPSFGSQVTFNLQTAVSQPWVNVSCSQNGQAVYGQYWGFWNGYSPSTVTSTMAANGVFTLGPTALWSSGTASCVATLYSVNSKNYKQTTLATLAFTATA